MCDINPRLGGLLVGLVASGVSIILFGLWPVPIEIRISGGLSASSGQINFLSESAIKTGLL